MIGVSPREVHITNLEVLDSYEMYVCYEHEFSVVVVLFLYKSRFYKSLSNLVYEKYLNAVSLNSGGSRRYTVLKGKPVNGFLTTCLCKNDIEDPICLRSFGGCNFQISDMSGRQAILCINEFRQLQPLIEL